jgi:hypothetical protein
MGSSLHVVAVVAPRVQYSFDLFPSVGVRVEDAFVEKLVHGESCDDLFSGTVVSV